MRLDVIRFGPIEPRAVEAVGALTDWADPLLTGPQPELTRIALLAAHTEPEGHHHRFPRRGHAGHDDGLLRDIGGCRVAIFHHSSPRSSTGGNGCGVRIKIGTSAGDARRTGRGSSSSAMRPGQS